MRRRLPVEIDRPWLGPGFISKPDNRERPKSPSRRCPKCLPGLRPALFLPDAQQVAGVAEYSRYTVVDSGRTKVRFMKTKLITATTLALVAASNMHNTMAGDREWATAGKVLTGIAAASIISRALEPRPTVV